MRENDHERGRENFEGHALRQVGKETIDILRVNRFLEFLGEFAFGGHSQVYDSGGSWKGSFSRSRLRLKGFWWV